MGCSSHMSLVEASLCQCGVWEALPELCVITTLDVYSGGVNSPNHILHTQCWIWKQSTEH